MTRRQNTLHTLQWAENQWVSAHDLIAAGSGYRYAARIHELRALGYNIEERRDPTGRSVLGEYRLVPQPVQTELGLEDAA